MLANMPHLPRHVEPDIARLCDEAVTVALEHVIRNAGGRASDDAILSLAISHKLHGTGEWFVIHTNCGMEIFTDEVIGASSCHPP